MVDASSTQGHYRARPPAQILDAMTLPRPRLSAIALCCASLSAVHADTKKKVADSNKITVAYR